MISSGASDEVWIGLAEVKQRSGAAMLMDRNEAIVNVLAMADSPSAFHQAAESALAKIGFDLVNLEDVESLRRRREQFQVADELLALAKEVARDGVARFGAFHTWTSAEADDV